VAAAEALAKSIAVYPPPKALEVSQDRLVEKRFLNEIGVPTAAFAAVGSDEQLRAALGQFGGSGVLKTRRMGYDGKGQRVFRDNGNADLSGIYSAMGGVPLILEALIPFEREVSVIAARGIDGTVVAYEPAENVHRNGILHTSTVPAAFRPIRRCWRVNLQSPCSTGFLTSAFSVWSSS
jgi:5-(carboxyamino)imidazole ribonucleotide synthase